MPRVAINKEKYLQTDLREWMKGRMDTLGINQEYMGKRLNMTQQAFSSRLRAGKFNNTQLYVIFRELEATDEKILQLMRL